jgi:hypothetical protein
MASIWLDREKQTDARRASRNASITLVASIIAAVASVIAAAAAIIVPFVTRHG